MKFRIDRQKWLDDVKEVLATRAQEPYRTRRYDALTERLVKLYSIRAEGRGTVHRRRARLSLEQLAQLEGKQKEEYRSSTAILNLTGFEWELFATEGGTKVLALTAEDQTVYIGDAWQKYARPEPETASTTTPVEAVKQTVGVIQ